MVSVSDFTSIINQLLPEPHAGLLNGIVFGTKASLSPELKDTLLRTGTIHITALSGMNITIIISLVATTLLRVFSRKVTSLLSLFFVIGFILFVGPSASVIRAGIMGSLSLLAVVFGRQRRALLFLTVTSLIMILIRPLYLTDLSFQLSVLATLGIILFASSQKRYQNLVDPTRERSPQASPSSSLLLIIPMYIWNLTKDDLRTTLAAQIFTTPLIALSFHRISLIAPLSNIAIGFLIAPLTALGMIISVLGFLWLPLAIPLAWVCWIVLEYMVGILLFFSSLPFASIAW